MCLGTHQPLPNPIVLGHKAIEESLMLNAAAAKNNIKHVETATRATSDQEEKRCNRRRNHHHPHIVVEHHYHDHSHDPYEQYQEEQHPARGGVTIPFPMKLHAMLDGVQREGLEDVCSWQPHGRSFVVHNPQEFVGLLPRYFKLTKLASFQRQLNLYGFQRLTRGNDRGAYYHELFLRGRPFLAHHIERMKVKGTGVRARSNPAQEPDFWSMEWMEEADPVAHTPPLSPSLNLLKQQPPFVPSMEMTSSPFVYPGNVPSLPSTVSATCLPIVSPTSMGKTKIGPKVSADDGVVSAFDKTFYYMDPFQPLPLEYPNRNADRGMEIQDPPAASEAERFFQDFVFPDHFFDGQIENDAIFGEMLESLIA
jgi:HSF-type DNA-binding